MSWTNFDYEQLASTSDKAHKLLKEEKTPPFFVSAKSQTKGKGCYGKTWTSPQGNIYLSIAVKMEEEIFNLSPIYAAVTIAKWLEKTFDFCITLKWPNDILFAGKKLGGILCEANPCHKNCVIIGVGINLNLAPENESYKTTSISSYFEGSFSVDQITKSLKDHWVKTWGTYSKKNILEEFKKYSMSYGQVWCEKNVAEKKFFYCGLNSQGHMIVASAGDKNHQKVISSSQHNLQWVYQQKNSKELNESIWVADIGNSATKFAFFRTFCDDHPSCFFSLKNNELDCRKIILSTIKSIKARSKDIKQIVIYALSVNQEIFDFLQKEMNNFDINFFMIEKKSLFLKTKYNFSQLGIDRLANMEGYLCTLDKSQRKASILSILISFGTATVVDIIQNNGIHLGGYITSGLEISTLALSDHTNLPKLNFQTSDKVQFLSDNNILFGMDTQSSLCYGMIYSQLFFLNYLKQSLIKIYAPNEIQVILTGGVSKYFLPFIKGNFLPFLTLKGAKALLTGGS